jgi:two-component system, response regulator
VTNPPVLLIEDNHDDETLTLRAFRKSSILNEVIVARDGAEALAYLFPPAGTNTIRPALILLDLKLPKVDGLEVLRRIRAGEQTRLIPVVVLTTSVQQEDVLAGYGNGANAYVRKPVRFAEFAAAVSTIGAFWLLLSMPVPDPTSLPCLGSTGAPDVLTASADQSPRRREEP